MVTKARPCRGSSEAAQVVAGLERGQAGSGRCVRRGAAQVDLSSGKVVLGRAEDAVRSCCGGLGGRKPFGTCGVGKVGWIMSSRTFRRGVSCPLVQHRFSSSPCRVGLTA